MTTRLICEDAVLRYMGTSADQDDAPKVEFAIACGKFTWENFEMDRNDAVVSAGKGSWNIKTNTP